MGLRVKAKTMGFRNGRRVRPGVEFTLEDGAAIPKWVEVLGETAPEKLERKPGETAPVKRGRKPAEPAAEAHQEEPPESTMESESAI